MDSFSSFDSKTPTKEEEDEMSLLSDSLNTFDLDDEDLSNMNDSTENSLYFPIYNNIDFELVADANKGLKKDKYRKRKEKMNRPKKEKIVTPNKNKNCKKRKDEDKSNSVTKKIKPEISDLEEKDKNSKRLRDWRLKKKLRWLEIPHDDIRRTLVQDYFQLMNIFDFEKLRLLMEKHFEPLFTFRLTDSTTRQFAFGLIPKKIEMRGIGNYVNFTEALCRSCPDRIDIIQKIIIRNSIEGKKQRSSRILFDVKVDYTEVFHVLMERDKSLEYFWTEASDSKDKYKRKDIVNLSELSEHIDDLNLSSAKDNLQFANGRVFSEKRKMIVHQSNVMHFNEDNQVYLLEANIICTDIHTVS